MGVVLKRQWAGVGRVSIPSMEVTAGLIKDEPMLYSFDMEEASHHGGPITRAFLDAVRAQVPDDARGIVDSRVHMLKPGWYPCIPGWHVDELWREGGQPKTKWAGHPESPIHFSTVLDYGTESLTEFVCEDVNLPAAPDRGENLYETWTKAIDSMDGWLGTACVGSGDLVRFTTSDLHRGVPAVGSGWRWFGRVTFGTRRKIRNEIRRQVNVYLTNPDRGW